MYREGSIMKNDIELFLEYVKDLGAVPSNEALILLAWFDAWKKMKKNNSKESEE
jgi:hypothetical protein